MAQFNSYIDALDISAATNFCQENGVLCPYKKDERFLQQGSVARYAALVVDGYFKFTTLNELGDEAVINSAFPGQFITDLHSSADGGSSEMSIIAGADSKVLRVSLKSFKEVCTTSFTLEYKALFKMTLLRHLNIYRKTPQQRYLDLCNEYPEIIKTVALKDIASFLLITPNHLSRIRRKFMIDSV